MEGKYHDNLVVLSSQHQGWSELPTEILGITFSYLPRKCDLLTGRLVCQSWNQECMRVLQKPESEFNQTLTNNNINKYLNFISDGESLPQLTLPFHLSITIRVAKPKSYHASEQLHKIILNNLIQCVELLCTIFGDECIQKLTLKTVPKDLSKYSVIIEFVKIWLIEFLRKGSLGLKILDLRDFAWPLGNYTEGDVKSDALKISDLNFPNLKTLICYKCKRLFEFNFGRFPTHPIYKYIIEKSPNLTSLEGIDSRDLITMPIRFDKLKSLQIDKIKIHPSELLDKFCQSKNSPVLQHLRYSIKHWIEIEHRISISILNNILECVSTTLKSFTVTVPYDGIVMTRLMTFPKLHTLQHLRIDVTTEDFLFLDPEEISFNPETLPMLKFVEFPLGLILDDDDYFDSQGELYLEEEREVRVKFTKVIELNIRLSSLYWLSGVGLYKGVWALKHLLKLFPNVTKLSVKHEYFELHEIQGVKHLLRALIQSPLSKSIPEICTDGFQQDLQDPGLGVDSHAVDERGASNDTFFQRDVRKLDWNTELELDWLDM